MKTGQHQHVLWSNCFHPSGCFSEFSKEELERSVPARFEKIVGQFPDRLAVKMESQILNYAELNAKANRVARTIVARLGVCPSNTKTAVFGGSKTPPRSPIVDPGTFYEVVF